jgi:hypothetical protein
MHQRILDDDNTYNTRIQHTGLGIERVDSGVDTKLSNTTGQHSCGVQVSEGRGGGGIGQIIGRDVDSLHGGDRTFLGGGDTLLPVKNSKLAKKTSSGTRSALTCHPYQWTKWAGNRRQRGYDQAKQTLQNRPE